VILILTSVIFSYSIGLKDWWAKYEQLSDMVVPRSSKLVSHLISLFNIIYQVVEIVSVPLMFF